MNFKCGSDAGISESEFGGDTPHEPADLRRQYNAVFSIMRRGEWYTIPRLCHLVELESGIRMMETSASARLRDMRKARFGGHAVEREYVKKGLWKYRLVLAEAKSAA